MSSRDATKIPKILTSQSNAKRKTKELGILNQHKPKAQKIQTVRQRRENGEGVEMFDRKDWRKKTNLFMGASKSYKIHQRRKKKKKNKE